MWHSGRRQKLKNYMGTPITANRVAWSLTAILGLGLSAGVAFYFGYDYGLQSVGASAGEVKQLRLSTQQQQKELLQLKNDLVSLKQDRDIAIQTAKKLQEDNKNQLASVADMQEQIMLFQRLLGAKGSTNTLSIENVTIKKIADNQFQYRLLLTQVTNNQTDISGKATVRILGMTKNQVITAVPVDFRFQYFKSVTGSMTLPVGFQADSIEITLQVLGKKATKIEKRFKWEVAT
ncbi:hypothetical protein FK216_08850 [Moraxellaceae bacterium AER2_44_116]|nr:hypothetical protein [Moraxellaceae bacterium]TQC97842.1 hypothetical protein FK216_08850 [Moraxellaceae bacterium AER2_44_116]